MALILQLVISMKEVVLMTTVNDHKAISYLMVLIIFTIIYPSLVAAFSEHQRVNDVCRCMFPAEVGAYKHFKAVKVRYTLFSELSFSTMMVKEIFAERKGEMYRIIALVVSTKEKTVGKLGPIIEILKWNGPYWPGKIIYQLSRNKINLASSKLNEK